MSQAQSQPLAGIRIVDMTHDWAGPHATRVMGDYGAEVIKIEYTHRLCGMRGAYLEKMNLHPRWWEINRNKDAITLDLHLAEHIEALEALIRESDVVVDNSRPGVLERFGLGYERLCELKSDIILVCMSAYGAFGPESKYAGYGGAIEAISGVQSLTAYEPEGDRMRVRELDVTNGVMGACAVVTALVHRELSGEGQNIDLSQREASTWLIGEHLLEWTANKHQTYPMANRHPQYAPQGCYRCAGDDRWVVVSIRNDAEWASLCEAMEQPAWAMDARFVDAAARRAHHDLIDETIGRWTETQSASDVMMRLQSLGIAAGRVADVSDLASDPHLLARDWFVPAAEESDETLADERAGEQRFGDRYPGFPFRFAHHPGGVFRRRGPNLGADNDRLLVKEAGLSENQLPSLDRDDLGTSYDSE